MIDYFFPSFRRDENPASVSLVSQWLTVGTFLFGWRPWSGDSTSNCSFVLSDIQSGAAVFWGQRMCTHTHVHLWLRSWDTAEPSGATAIEPIRLRSVEINLTQLLVKPFTFKDGCYLAGGTTASCFAEAVWSPAKHVVKIATKSWWKVFNTKLSWLEINFKTPLVILPRPSLILIHLMVNWKF